METEWEREGCKRKKKVRVDLERKEDKDSFFFFLKRQLC